MANNYYDILGIDKAASEKDIKSAYKKLAMKYHPDRQNGKSDSEKKEAEEKFKDISHAYEVLSDPQKKQNYDTFGDENGNPGFGGGGNPFAGFGGFNPFGEFNPFGDIFGHSRKRQNTVQPGRDIQMRIPVTIEEIFNGVKKTVKYKKNVRCSVCHGAGGSGQKTCPKCHGTGRIIKQQQFGPGQVSIQEEVCPLCGGTGMYVEKKCDRCGGTGFEKKEVTLEVLFPTGVQDGEYKVYKQHGNESKSPTGPDGNFMAIAEYNFDKEKYVIEGLNVIEHIYVPYYELLLGCSYTVNIPNGVKKTIKLESCIKEGTLKRLTGEGLKRPEGQKGDYYVCVHYLIPDKLSEKEQKVLTELRKY